MNDISTSGAGGHRYSNSGALGTPAARRAAIRRPRSQRITYIQGTKDNILKNLQSNCPASQMRAANKVIQDNDVVRIAGNNCIIINRNGIKGKIIISPKGLIREKYPDGRTTTTAPNGSKVHTSSEGKRYRLNSNSEVISMQSPQKLTGTPSVGLQRHRDRHENIRRNLNAAVGRSQDIVRQYEEKQKNAPSGDRKLSSKMAPQTRQKNKLLLSAKEAFKALVKKWLPNLSKITLR